MPLPKALQAALDATPTPDQPTNVFDFEATNKVVQPVSEPPIDTSEDDWMDKLMSGDAPVVDVIPDGDAGDFLAPDTTDDDFTLPDINDDSDLRDIINGLEAKINKGEAETAQKAALDEARAKIKEKYGTVDEDLMVNFEELFNSFRAQFGTEFGEELLETQTNSDAKIAALEAKVEALTKSDQPVPDTNKGTINEYRDFMAGAVTDYQKIVGSDKFKRLMATPVDADNPEFTFNKKLGKLYGQRRTAEIMKFFSSFSNKYLGSGGDSGAVVDSGSALSSKGGMGAKNTLSPDRLRSIFQKVMKGELVLSEAEMLKLRQMAAKQTMD